MFNGATNFYNLNNENFHDFLMEMYRKIDLLDKDTNYIRNHLIDELRKELRKIIANGELIVDIESVVDDFLRNGLEENKVVNEIKSKINYVENKTATKQEVEVERKRIDNIVKNEGSSVDDIELQDIRCGYDGKVYNSAGSAVRTQIKGLALALDTTSKTGKYNLNSIGMWSSGGIDSTTGNDIAYSTRLRSDFIPENITACEVADGYEIAIFTYKKSDGSFFGIDNFDGITYRTRYEFQHNLKYRIVLRQTSNGEISLDEFNNVLLLNDETIKHSPSEIMKKQQNLEYRPNIELESGTIDSSTGVVTDADYRARTVDYIKVKKGYKVEIINGRYFMNIYMYTRKNGDYYYLKDTYSSYGFLSEYEFEEDCYIKIVFAKSLNPELDFSISEISECFITNFAEFKKYENKNFIYNITNNCELIEPKLFNGAMFEDNKIILNNCSGVGTAIYYYDDISYLPVGAKIDVTATITFNDFSVSDITDRIDMKFKVVRNNTTMSISSSDKVLQFGVQRFYEKSKKLICKIDYTIQDGDEKIIPIINLIGITSVENMVIDIESINLKIDSEDIISINKNKNRKHTLPSTVIVAAHNSSSKNKAIADYVCDGINDEVEIQKAIDTFDSASGRVILCNGNYYIDSLYDTGNAKCGKYGLYISNPENNHNVIIEGISRPNRKLSTEVGISPTIFLRDTVYNSLEDDEIVTILGVLPSNIDKLTKTYPNINLTIKNLAINIPGNKKAITLISGEYASNMQVDYFLGSITGNSNYQDINNEAVSTTPNEKCIGLRLLPGQNFGTGFRIDNCFIWGMNVAYDIGGEHLIMNDCGCRLCNISYRFNGYENEKAMSHPNTLINCCEESCLSSLYFCKSSVKQSINIIDYNMEIRPVEGIWGRKVKAIEEVPGSFRGNITYSANYEDYVNRDDIELWEKGSGLNIKTVNLNHKHCGTTSERPTHPNLNQQYYDTTINKMIVYINDKWVDFLGNQV